jgi:mannose-1-phosphate guanylyltransferase
MYMITVIIAGGSGTRLWPLSTPDNPKHLLKVVGEQSLLQSTYERVKLLGSSIYVITEQGHAHLVREQLSELPDDAFIVEPGRRSTASCVIAGLHHIESRHDNDEPIAFIAADHFIRDVDGFVRSFKLAEDASKKYERQVLIGVEPTYPSTGLGYIEKSDSIGSESLIFNVRSYKEKPDLKTAQSFLASGRYLWNCSYFVGSFNVFYTAMRTYAPVLLEEFETLKATKTKDEYNKVYLNFLSEQIDTALNEKVKDLLVIPATFDWMDIGSFKDLHEAAESDELNNHIRGRNICAIETENSYIRNDEDKPVVVIGVNNIAVINTPHGTLVVRKDLGQKVKDAVAMLTKGEHNNE